MEKKVLNFFLNLEKRNHVQKHIRKLHISGVTKTDPFSILNEQEQFYCDLYKSGIINADAGLKMTSFLRYLNISTLSNKQKISCEGKISSEECFRLFEGF